ncbi:hypothetical protein GCM10023213_23030 [Prosthecobacter algae]|uniref:Uncharacterized protein n=1 Tax=Prosthecobacter algae TaxID=1144682 RepID=A0ABP9P8V2_9BACT
MLESDDDLDVRFRAPKGQPIVAQGNSLVIGTPLMPESCKGDLTPEKVTICY